MRSDHRFELRAEADSFSMIKDNPSVAVAAGGGDCRRAMIGYTYILLNATPYAPPRVWST